MIVHLVSNKVWGGGEQYVLDLLKALAADKRCTGHQLVAVTRGYPVVNAPFAAAGISLLRLPLRGAIDLYSPLRLAAHIKRFTAEAPLQPVIIHAHNFKDAFTAVRAARLLRRSRPDVKVVVTRHQVKPAKTDSLHTTLYRRIDALIFVSQLARDRFLSTHPAEPQGKHVHVVYNGVSLPELPPPEGSRPGTALVYHGRLSHEKGIEVAIRALPMLPDATLTLIGAGSDDAYVESLHALARSLGVEARVNFLGFTPEPWRQLGRYDIGVYPSTVSESFGLAIVEAMGCGLPVVTTDCGAQREYIVSGENSILIPPGSPEALAEAVASLTSDPHRLEAMRRAARDTYLQRFTYPKFYNNITRIYGLK